MYSLSVKDCTYLLQFILIGNRSGRSGDQIMKVKIRIKPWNLNVPADFYTGLSCYYNYDQDRSYLKLKDKRNMRNQLLKNQDCYMKILRSKDKRLVKIQDHVYHYSSSYSGNMALVTYDKESLGADIERYCRLSEVKAELFMKESEKILCEQLFENRRSIEQITFLWCLKESVGKLFGFGLSLGIQEIELVDKNYDQIINVYVHFFNDACMVVSQKFEGV